MMAVYSGHNSDWGSAISIDLADAILNKTQLANSRLRYRIGIVSFLPMIVFVKGCFYIFRHKRKPSRA